MHVVSFNFLFRFPFEYMHFLWTIWWITEYINNIINYQFITVLWKTLNCNGWKWYNLIHLDKTNYFHQDQTAIQSGLILLKEVIGNLAHKTSLTPPLFIEVPVPNQDHVFVC
jgi:hypothetical protein